MDEGRLNESKEKLVRSLISMGALRTPRIIGAFRKIPRHMFVPEERISFAYEDIALPTIKGSTISQPYTVAVMLEELRPAEGEKVLEIGAGSGWQACLLSHCVGKKGRVITVEIDKEVADFAKGNVNRFGFENIEMVHGDGSVGYEKEAPFDGIVYTAAVPKMPRMVMRQLNVGGRIVAPVGSKFGQTMTVIERVSKDKFEEKHLGDFLFVPLLGKFGFRDS